MKKSVLVLFIFCLSSISIAQEMRPAMLDSLRILVVTGGPTLKHQINLVPTSFYSLFMGYDHLSWDHASHDEAAFQSERLPDYDVLLMYNRSDTLSEKSRQNLKQYLESGKGLIVLHHALGSYNTWEWWWKEVVGGKYQMKENNAFPKSGYKQGEPIRMIAERDHPIAKTIKDFVLWDETYKDLWISREAEILYRTDNPSSDGPTVWISPYTKSKVIVIQPGHAEAAHLDENYKNLVYQAILWAAGNQTHD